MGLSATGKISDDPDKPFLDGTEKLAAVGGGINYGILLSTIRSWVLSSISGLTTAMFAANVIDTDTTLAANSDTRLASQKAVKAYADARIAAQDAMVFKGATDCSGNPNYPAADRGHTYRVSVAGKIGGASGVVVEIGDMFICNTDATAGGNQAAVGAKWNVIQTNIDGAVTGPASATSGNLATYNGTSGKIIQDGGAAISTDGTFASNADTKVPTEKAVKTYFAANAGAGRAVLTADRTYYVRSDGNDSNNGLADTSGGAFLTIQKAMDVAAAIDCGHWQLTVSAQAGTWTAPVVLPRMLSAKAPILTGVGSTTILSVAANTGILANGCTPWILQNMKLTGSGAGAYCVRLTNGAAITLGSGIEFGATTGYHIYVHGGCGLTITSNYTISGGADFHLVSNGWVYSSGITVTLTGTPTFSSGYCVFNLSGASYFASGMTFSGSATGQRFIVSNGASIYTGGGGANYFPGNVAGSGTNPGASPYGMYS
ncbi:hypothetical protein ACKWRH_25360 [Bradyrhizobium sp. Pa8]|uniref:hypothetical protein n=1 Tax=Bradyrhizobium sp. Pa8 TaxID=3386552 RepID=UPI00403F2864